MAKKKKGWFGSISGGMRKIGQIGELSDAKGNVTESVKQGLLAIATGVGGVILGSAVGKASLFAGMATAVAGAYYGNVPVLTAGVGMLGGGNRKLTPEQQAEIDAKYPKNDFTRQKAISMQAVTNSVSELKEKTYIDALYPKSTAKDVVVEEEVEGETETPILTLLNGVNIHNLKGVKGLGNVRRLGVRGLGNVDLHQIAGLNIHKI